MTTPARGREAAGAPLPPTPPMTATRWRVVDAILQAALACDPERRDAFVADACGADAALRDEVASLLAAHGPDDDDFLERPAIEGFTPLAASAAAPALPPDGILPLADRLARALDGRYVVERQIAEGGMARVFLARDLRHGRRVAIKVLRDEVAAAVGAERFLEEIRVTAGLQHPHVLPLFDSGSANGLLWYVMPYVAGETLRARLAREGPLPVDTAVALACEVAEALDHAHRRGVVHRDVKPENILLHDGHALVADFGIALALAQAGEDRLTRTGLTLGTPQYMAPEQATGDRALDARVDVYALGAVLHEMLAGEPPFASVSRRALVHRVLHEPPTALATRRPDVGRALDAAVRRALAKRPAERHPSATAFAAALRAALVVRDAAAPATARDGEDDGEPTPRRSPPPPGGRTLSARTALNAAVVTLALGLAGGWVIARSAFPGSLTGALSEMVRPRPVPAAVLSAPSPAVVDAPLVVLDRSGRAVTTLDVRRPWTPRFSPDGRRVAYGAFGDGRGTSDVWVLDLERASVQRLTDDDGDANDPQWSPDGALVAYSVAAPEGKDLMARAPATGQTRLVARRPGTQFASDWLRDGSALLVTEEAGENRRDVIVQPADGAPAWPYAATAADETAARISPDGRWVAYTSDVSGQPEVYVDAFPKPWLRRKLSDGGGAHPVWRGDGNELYYWRDGELIAVQLGGSSRGAAPTVLGSTTLFRWSYDLGPNTMYDVSPDGQRFVIVRP